MKLALEKNTRREIAKNQIMINFYSNIKHDDEKLDADREIKIENLKQTNDFNRKFIEFICG